MFQQRYFQKKYEPRVRKNEQIHAPKVRVIDNSGENLGILDIKEALEKAKEAGLDLIEITAKADPPVVRIMEYGKYLYQQGKKDKAGKKKQTTGETKGVRIGMTTFSHDLEVKAKMVDKFFKKGYKVKVELVMHGREKALGKIADKKIGEFLLTLKEKYKMEQEPKKYPRGLYFIISPQ